MEKEKAQTFVFSEYELHTSGYVIEMFPDHPERILFSKFQILEAISGRF